MEAKASLQMHNVYPWQRGKTSRRRNGPRLIETPSHSSSKKQFVILHARKHALPMFYFLFICGLLNTEADIKRKYDHAAGTCCSGSSQVQTASIRVNVSNV